MQHIPAIHAEQDLGCLTEAKSPISLAQRPTTQDDPPSPNPPPAPCFFTSLSLPVTTQDGVVLYSLNLRKPNALKILVCQNRMPTSFCLHWLMQKGPPKQLGAEMEVHESQDLSGWF